MNIREELEGEYMDVVFADSKFDNALIGIVEGFGIDPSPLYDKNKIFKKELSNFDHFYIDGRKTVEEISEIEIKDGESDFLFPTGHNEDVIGVLSKKGCEDTALYDREKVIERMAADFIDEEDPYMDALENYCFI